MSGYVFMVDASSWILMHEERYCPDILPGLWTHLRSFGEQGRIKTTREVLGEVRGDKEGVGAWLRTIQPTIVVPVTTAIGTRVGELVTAYPDLVEDYTTDADPWLIAFAEHHDWVVVTEERPSSGPTPKIPNVCQDLDVTWIDCTEMIRRLAIRWESDDPEQSAARSKKQFPENMKKLFRQKG